MNKHVNGRIVRGALWSKPQHNLDPVRRYYESSIYFNNTKTAFELGGILALGLLRLHTVNELFRQMIIFLHDLNLSLSGTIDISYNTTRELMGACLCVALVNIYPWRTIEDHVE